MTGGTLAAVAILAGIVEARATGRGRHLDLFLQEAAGWAIALPMAEHLADGSTWAPGQGMLNGAIPCYGIYRCADGLDLAVGALEPHFWERFVRLIGRADLSDRREDPTAIDEVSGKIASRPRAEWLELLEDADCCVAPVKTLADAVEDEQARARDVVTELSGDGWAVRQPGLPMRVQDYVPTRSPAPALGADNGWARRLARR